MPRLDDIFSAANHSTAGDNETAVLSGVGLANEEPFDQVMSRALSPGGTSVPWAPNPRQQMNTPGAQKRNFTDAKSSPASVRIPVDSPTTDADSSMPVKTKDGRPEGEAAGKDANPPVQSGAGDLLDAARQESIFLLASALAACPLKPFVADAVPQSEANNPSVAAVLPAGAEGKSDAAAAVTFPGVEAAVKPSVADAVLQLEANVPHKTVASKNALPPAAPAQTTSVETSGDSAAAPTISEQAGTGNAQPERGEAISADDSLPDDSGQPVGWPNPVAEPALFTPAKSHGTSVAKQDVPMKNSEQTNKTAGFAGPDEKVLPGDAVPAARANMLSVRGSCLSVQARVEPAEVNAATALAAQENTVPSARPAEEAAVVENVSNLRSQALDRTHDLVMQQTLRLVDAKTDSLHVVLMPEAGTKLSLELRQRGNDIEAQAVLQSGDLENLRQHWPELQQRLELRGIKLAPLMNEGNSALWSGHQGSKNQPEPSAERESLLSGAFAEFGPAGVRNNLPAEPASPAALSRGWQTWA